MANELNIALEDTGKVDVIAQIVDSTGQIGGNIAMSEIGSTKVYSGDITSLSAGVYSIRYEDTSGLIGTSGFQWDGTQELNFTNIDVIVNVPSTTTNAAAGIPVLLSDVDGSNRNSDNVIRFLFDEKQSPILYQLKDFLDSINKNISDLSAATFMIKENRSDADIDAKYTKVLTDSELVVDIPSSSMSVLISDYTNLVVKSRYVIVLGLMFPSDTQFREVPANKQLIEFREDVIRA